MIRAVLDTNVIVSAILRPGVPSRVYRAAVTRQFASLTTETLVLELIDVMGRAKFSDVLAAAGYTIDSLAAEYRTLSEFVEPAAIPQDAVRDLDDVALLACAVGGKADYLISGDKDLLILSKYDEVSIVTPAQFLVYLTENEPPGGKQPHNGS
jgi:putative PIN family toxin of toxin-antitoxin system